MVLYLIYLKYTMREFFFFFHFKLLGQRWAVLVLKGPCHTKFSSNSNTTGKANQSPQNYLEMTCLSKAVELNSTGQ